jgi:hypothetical protein
MFLFAKARLPAVPPDSGANHNFILLRGADIPGIEASENRGRPPRTATSPSRLMKEVEIRRLGFQEAKRLSL